MFLTKKFSILCYVLVFVLLSGTPGTTVKASSAAISQINVSTPSHPIGMRGMERKLIPYSLTESWGFSGTITARTYQFYTQYEVPLSDLSKPYPASIPVAPQQTSEWNELVYLPGSVVLNARALEEYAIILKTTFLGKLSSGANFQVESSLLILLPPAAFSK